MMESKALWSQQRVLILVFGIGFLIQAAGLLLDAHLGDAWRFANIPVHAGVEMAGAVIAIVVAYLLMRADASKDGGSFDRLIASALIGMGFLDGLHALMPPGKLFVWFHSAATLLGGLLFALVWVGPLLSSQALKAAPWVAFGAALIGGVASLLWPQLVPGMLLDGAFTPVALGMNLVGGLCMLAAAVKLYLTYRRHHNNTDLLFGLQCALFGMAAVMFEHSKVWDAPWWTWHVLRLAAYAVSLQLVMSRSESRGEIRLREQLSKNEQLSRDNKALLSTLDLHAIISTTDGEGRITEVNDAFCTSSGYSREELIGKSHRILGSGIQSHDFWVEMWNSISNGKPWRGEVCNRAKDGSFLWMDTFIAPYVGEDGSVEKYVSIRTDITASKHAEAAVQRSEELLRGAIDAVDEAFVLYDPDERLIFCNEKNRSLYPGLADLLVPGVHFPELLKAGLARGLFPDAAGCEDEWLQQRLQTFRQGNSTHVHHTEKGRTLRMIQRRLPDGHTVMLRMDITELVQATEAAQAASLSKSQFLANMSHELRTPMNAVLGMLTLLRKTELTARQADYAAKSDGAARALLGLLNEILDFSKIEAGKMTLDPHIFAVDQLLRDLSTILSSSVGEKPVEVLFDIDPLLPRQLVGDAMRLQQILLNLASNAIKFTAQGEVVLSIKVMLRTDDVVTAQFSMRDSGIGIAPENQARIFSGFTQAESSTTRKYGGSGLGVAISQRFVNMMGGELELESEVDKGSRFYFTVTLPIATQVDEAERARLRTRAQSALWRALVIDDNPAAREVLEHMGQSLGWKMDLAESGEQALALVQQRAREGNQYQAIFVDWSMPGMDGWETSQRIRALQALSSTQAHAHKTPILVMVTSHGREILLQRSAKDQALLDGFLVKPVTASMLFDAVIDAQAGHDSPHPSRTVIQTTERRLDGMRLLLVEDNLNNQQIARELLEDEGAVVQIANHGQEAVESIAATIGAGDGSAPAFDVVLMDLQMPVMDGFSATRAIRQDLGLLTLPIVAMSANAMASDREACLAVGMNDHVGKPFDLNDLVRVLHRQAQRDDVLPQQANSGKTLSDAVAQAASDAGVDIATALHRLGGKQDVYRRMLKTFVKDTQSMPEQLLAFTQAYTQAHAHEEGATPDDAKRLLHTLKGLAATMGAGALAAAAASAEKALADTPTPETSAGAAAQACEAIASALPGLHALLAAMKHDQAQAEAHDLGAAEQVLDRPALVSALQMMEHLLQSNDMESMHAMAQLQQQFGRYLGDQIDALETAMAELEFGNALLLCIAMQEKYARPAIPPTSNSAPL
jgi:PAS domain S-box-containing protein